MRNLTIAVTARSIERTPNSVNGNPRYIIRTDHGRFHTAPDAAFGYSLPNYFNPAHRPQRVPMTITTNGWGKVSDIVFHDMRAA